MISRLSILISFILVSIGILYSFQRSDSNTTNKSPPNIMSAVRLSSITPKPTAAVIIFHGLGDSGNGWKFFGELARKSDAFDHINFIFPTAPTRPVTVAGGKEMPAWFDIYKFGGDTTNQDTTGYLEAVRNIDGYIKEQMDLGIDSTRIIVGGFSQGGGIALGTLVNSELKIGGVLAFSPAVRFYDTLRAVKKDVNLDTPVFHGHGDADQMISKAVSDANVEFFTKELGYKNYTYKSYPGLQHWVSDEELEYSFEFIKKILPNR